MSNMYSSGAGHSWRVFGMASFVRLQLLVQTGVRVRVKVKGWVPYLAKPRGHQLHFDSEDEGRGVVLPGLG